MPHIKLYALSTCIWCRKTEKLLNDLKCKFDVTYVDKLSGQERETVMQELESFNPKRSFPTLVVDKQKIVVGFKPEDIQGAVGK